MRAGGSVVLVSSVTAYRWGGGGAGLPLFPSIAAVPARCRGAARAAVAKGPSTSPQPLPPPPPRISHPTHSVPFPIAAYAVSKTALLGLVKGLAAEMGPSGVRVNGVVRASLG